MGDHHFDVDASIVDGWHRFSAHLSAFLNDMDTGDTFDIAIPVVDSPSTSAPYVRFSCSGTDIAAELSGDNSLHPEYQLTKEQRARLVALGWRTPETGADLVLRRSASAVTDLASRVARALETVYGVPHPAFLDDVTSKDAATRPVIGDPVPDDPDFRAIYISTPDEATRAIGTALAQVYTRSIPADEHDVFAVPAGNALLFVRAHQSLPLVLFRCPLVSSVTDTDVAEREVATLNRESLWCRYVCDGESISAESDLVDRVFVPVNFKIQLLEIVREIADVHHSLNRKLKGNHWLHLRSPDNDEHGTQ